MVVEDDPIVYRAILTPHRSLSSDGFFYVMSFFAVVSLVSGLYFVSLGAWPVLGFFGLEIGLLYWALKRNFADGEGGEALELTGKHLRIYKKTRKTSQKLIEWVPFFVRLDMKERHYGRVDVILRQKQDEILIGQFLSEPEKRAFAKEFGHRLRLVRQGSLRPI